MYNMESAPSTIHITQYYIFLFAEGDDNGANELCAQKEVTRNGMNQLSAFPFCSILFFHTDFCVVESC